MQTNTLKSVKKSVALCFLGVLLQLAVALALAFAVDGYAWKLLFKSTFGKVVLIAFALISVIMLIIVVVSACKQLKGCLAVQDEKKTLETKTFLRETWSCGVGVCIAVMPYMIGMSVLSGGTLYSPWVWIAFFACLFAWKIWGKAQVSEMKASEWIDCIYTLLKTVVLLCSTLLLTKTEAVAELFVSRSLHDNLLGTYGLLDCVRYAVQAIFPFASVWLVFGFLESETVEEEKTIKKCTWFVVAITLVDCALCIVASLRVSSFMNALGGWLGFARMYFIPALLLVFALHAIKRFPSGEETRRDIKALIEKRQASREKEQIREKDTKNIEETREEK